MRWLSPGLLSLLVLCCVLGALAETHDVGQQNKHFSQEEISIKVNDTINS